MITHHKLARFMAVWGKKKKKENLQSLGDSAEDKKKLF